MKKAIAIILTLCILGAAGYFGWQAYQKYIAQPADSGSATLVTPLYHHPGQSEQDRDRHRHPVHQPDRKRVA